MIRLATLGWWLFFLLLLPVLLPQALLSRRRAIRLEPAAGPWTGVVGAGDEPPLRLLLVGESTVAGVGVASQREALGAQLAEKLAAQLKRPVTWQALGENGITACEATERLLPQVANQRFDLVLLVFGVNDTTHFTSSLRWQAALSSLAQTFIASGCQIAFTAVPPMQHFSALPWLLRRMLGLRAALLDRQLGAVADQFSAAHCQVVLEFTPAYLARDGYHPSARGYQVWAEGLSALLVERLRH